MTTAFWNIKNRAELEVDMVMLVLENMSHNQELLFKSDLPNNERILSRRVANADATTTITEISAKNNRLTLNIRTVRPGEIAVPSYEVYITEEDTQQINGYRKALELFDKIFNS